MTQQTNEAGGPWTSHGHAVDGVTVAGGYPPAVARCGGPALCSACAADAERLRRQHAPAWLVWSNQRGMWWRADERGYTSFLHEAGLYSREQADRIVANASCDGQLVRTRVDPVTGKEHTFLDEVAIPAPAALV